MTNLRSPDTRNANWLQAVKRLTFVVPAVLLAAAPRSVQAVDWTVYRQETFDGTSSLSNLQSFGNDNWLTAEIQNSADASITIAGGQALFKTTDFPGQALFRITDPLPKEYKIRVKLGQVSFRVDSYDANDWTNPAFSDNPYNTDSNHWLENGFYWGVVTDKKCEGAFGNPFWHDHRKLGMDACEHVSDSWGTEYDPFYMVYSQASAYNKPTVGSAYDANGELKSDYIGTWDPEKNVWDTSTWSWKVADTYSETAYYWAELEKSGGSVYMRLFDADMNLLEATTALNQNLVYNMGANASPEEYFYLGDPDVDCNEGSAYIDEIVFFVPVPEPSMIMLGVLGILGLAARRHSAVARPSFGRKKAPRLF